MINKKCWMFIACIVLVFWAATDAVSATKKAQKRDVTSGKSVKIFSENTIVPTSDRISDDDARLALARVLSYDDSLLDESVREYEIILKNQTLQTNVRYELAEVYMRQKKYQDALREFNTVLLKEPENFRAKVAVGRIYLWTENLEKAALIFDELSRNANANADVFLELARAYSWNKQYDKAIAAYEQAIHRMDKAGFEGYAELGDTCLYAAQLSKAVENYRKALTLNPLSHVVEKKLALALSWTGQDQEALLRLEKLYARFPDDREIIIELGRVLVRRDEPEKALVLLEAMRAKHPKDVEFVLAAADIEADLGHAKKCRDLYLTALVLSKNDKKILLRFADKMMLWGDFYSAEKIYRNHLKAQPDDAETMLRLALVLLSSERYEEAEGIYQKLLLNNQVTDKVLLALAKLKIQEKNNDAALLYVDRFLSAQPGNKAGYLVRAEALQGAGKYQEALENYEFITKDPFYRTTGLFGMGKVYLKQGLPEKAKLSFKKVYEAEPENAGAQFYLAGYTGVTDHDFVKEALRSAGKNPRKLEAWARLYATNGLNDIALTCYRSALANDPQYFPARIGLAEMLAIDHQYNDSVNLYRELEKEFPEASKIMIGQARVLGWSKRYQESIELYENIHQINQDDPVVLKEMARVAMWGKMIDKAMGIYGKLFSPAVDRNLVTALAPLAKKIKDKAFIQSYKRLNENVTKGSVYQGYEAFDLEFKSYAKGLSFDVQKKIQLKQVELLSTYRIQKAAYLEKQAKELTWNKRFTRAMGVYEEMVQFNPGNEEAIFDYAQVECTLGLCDREATTYKKLLQIDPLHSLANQALNRLQTRKNPSLELSDRYWREEGRGDLARIKRNQSDLLLDIPVWRRYHFGIIGHHWNENPDFTGKTYDANGYTLQFKGVLSAYAKGEAAWTHKEYSDNSFKNRDSGHGHMWFTRIKGYISLTTPVMTCRGMIPNQ